MTSIKAQSVSIDFPIYNLNARSLKSHILNLTTGGILKSTERKCVVVRALDNLNFDMHNGDRIGLIGHNGAGKSTLLRVLAQIYEPTAGVIQFNGKVFPLFDLMLGFNPESTGFENIMIRGMLLGMSRPEILEMMDEIVAFTELGNYLALPVRTYSSGMQLRLAFGITIHMRPEILLMDEMISVGDAKFISKADQKMQSFLKTSNIIVLASHSERVIKDMCNKAILLEHGKLKFMGDVDEAFKIYHKGQ